MLKMSTVWDFLIPEALMHLQCRDKDLPPTALCLQDIHLVVTPLASLVNAQGQIRAQSRLNLCHMPTVGGDKIPLAAVAALM